MKQIPVKYPSSYVLRLIAEKGSLFWQNLARKKSLETFKNAARLVPAYKDFLRKNRVNPCKINTWADFQHVPPTSKKTYLTQYPLTKLCWHGRLDRKRLVFTATSGSTGEPFYFPREGDIDWQYSVIIESFLKNGSFKKGPILVIIGFGMGVWIGGIITYKAFEIAGREHPVSILTPGINKKEIFSALKRLSPQFTTTILVGYPPFVKDIIDEAKSHDIDLKKLNIRLLFAAETFNERFREYLVEKSGVKNRYLDTLNIYGSADIGAMAFETPLSILARHLSLNNKSFFDDLFPDTNKIPTLAQFIPLFINFEAINKEILLTGNNMVPLIRYSIGDHGGVFTFDELVEKLKNQQISLSSELTKSKIAKSLISKLPFVYVYERIDLSTKLYGAIIYPEHIREAIQAADFENHLTGKFTIITKHDKHQNQYLEVNLESKDGVKIKDGLKNRIKKSIVASLLEKNAEYRNNASMMPEKVEPVIVFWKHEHPLHFQPGTKQKWVKFS